MTILRLYLDRGWPDSHPDLAWSLIDRMTGKMLRSGQGQPNTWPGATFVELMIPAGQTLFTQALLPDIHLDKRMELIGYAIEDQLIGDPASNTYALSGRNNKGESLVAAIDANQVRRAIGALKQLRRLVDRIVPEECLLPYPPQNEACAIWSLPQGWVVRKPHEPIIFIPHAAIENDFFQLIWTKFTPAYLDVYQEKEEREGIPIWDGETRYHPSLDWHQGLTDEPYNFAIGQLAANRRWLNIVKLGKKSAKVAGLFLGAYCLSLCIQTGYLAWGKYSLQRTIKTEAAPYLRNQVPAADVPLALLRTTDQLRMRHGLPPRDSLLAAMQAFQSAVGEQAIPMIANLSYEAGRTTLTTTDIPPATFKIWQEKLKAQGWDLSKRAAQQGQQILVIRRSL